MKFIPKSILCIGTFSLAFMYALPSLGASLDLLNPKNTLENAKPGDTVTILATFDPMGEVTYQGISFEYNDAILSYNLSSSEGIDIGTTIAARSTVARLKFDVLQSIKDINNNLFSASIIYSRNNMRPLPTQSKDATMIIRPVPFQI